MLGTLYFGIIEGMKVLLYLEGKSVLQKSGIGRALQHQMHALDLAGIPYTTDILGDYDVVHINTYGPRSFLLLHAAKRRGKKVIMHGHSTREDFENSFIGSNFFAPLFGKYLAHMYQKADYVITPSEYSKHLIQSYGVTTPISHQHTVLRDIPVYNGWIDETSSELCHNVDEFVDSLNKVLNGQVDKREAGYKVAESRSIDLVAHQLVEAYQTVLEM